MSFKLALGSSLKALALAAALTLVAVTIARAEVRSDPPSGVCFTTVPEYVAFYRGAFGYTYYANIPYAVRVCGYSPAQMSQLNQQIVNNQV